MPYAGLKIPDYQTKAFITYAVIAAVLFAIQIVFLRKMKIVAVYMLPLLSFCICYENVLLSYSDNVSLDSIYAGNVFHALQFPLFIIVLFEASLRLHEVRFVHFFCIPFDEGHETALLFEQISLWVVRVIAGIIFWFTVLVNFEVIVDPQNTPEAAGRGGYKYLAEHDTSGTMWFSLVPSIVLSFFSLNLSFVLYRYGNNMTLTLAHNKRWRLILLFSLLQTIGQIFSPPYYLLTSNAGNLFLLIGATLLIKLVQDDLKLAGNFANFLHSSNVAFGQVELRDEERGSIVDVDPVLLSASGGGVGVGVGEPSQTAEELRRRQETLQAALEEQRRLGFNVSPNSGGGGRGSGTGTGEGSSSVSVLKEMDIEMTQNPPPSNLKASPSISSHSTSSTTTSSSSTTTSSSPPTSHPNPTSLSTSSSEGSENSSSPTTKV